MTKYTTIKVMTPVGGSLVILEEAQQEANRRTAVDKAIAASNRAGHKIGGREARMIQALLTGRTK